jgi:hypothetical protein
MRRLLLIILPLVSLAAIQITVHAQVSVKYNYTSQQKLLPTELGAIYMGMDLKAFSQKIKIAAAEVNDQFEELTLDIPFEKSNIKKLSVKFTGLTAEQKTALVKTEKIIEKGEYGDYEREVKHIVVPALMAAGKLYEIRIFYKEGFDLKKYVTAKYGKPDDVYKKGDDHHIFDMQWFKTSIDKLSWLIRFHEETKVLQLAGRIPGSEWSVRD